MKSFLQKPFFIPLGIFLLNVAFKCVDLDTYPIWYDEVWSVFFSQGTTQQAINVGKWDITPPFYYVILGFWMKVFGISEFSVRFMSVLFSAGAAVLLYAFVKKFFDLKTALIVSLLFISSDVSFFYAHEARGYSLIQFITIGSTWVIFEMIRKPSWWQVPIIGASYYALFLTQYLTGFILLCQGLIILTSFNWKTILHYAASCVVFVALFAHWIPRFTEIFLSGERSSWLWHPSYDDLWKFFFYFHNGMWAFYGFYLLCIISLILMIARKEFVPKEQKRILWFAFLLSFGAMLANFYISIAIPMFLERYLLFTVTGFIIIIGFFIARLPLNPKIVYGFMLAVCVYFAINIDTTTPKRMNYAEVVRYVKQKRDNKTDVVVQSNKMLFAYYFDREIFKDHNHLDDRLREKYIEVAVDSGNYKSFLFPADHHQLILVQTWQDATDPDSTLIKRINQDYVLSERAGPFEGADVWLFKRKQ